MQAYGQDAATGHRETALKQVKLAQQRHSFRALRDAELRRIEHMIIGVLKEAETGVKVAELCRKHGISDAIYYNWKAKFGGMTVSEAQ